MQTEKVKGQDANDIRLKREEQTQLLNLKLQQVVKLLRQNWLFQLLPKTNKQLFWG